MVMVVVSVVVVRHELLAGMMMVVEGEVQGGVQMTTGSQSFI